MCEFNEAVTAPRFQVKVGHNRARTQNVYYARRNGGEWVKVTARKFQGMVRGGAEVVA